MKKMNFKFLIVGGVLCLVLLLMPLTAHAVCSNPAGAEGDQVYNTTHKTMQYCDGTNWIAMKGGGTASGLSRCRVRLETSLNTTSYGTSTSPWTTGSEVCTDYRTTGPGGFGASSRVCIECEP